MSNSKASQGTLQDQVPLSEQAGQRMCIKFVGAMQLNGGLSEKGWPANYKQKREI